MQEDVCKKVHERDCEGEGEVCESVCVRWNVKERQSVCESVWEGDSVWGNVCAGESVCMREGENVCARERETKCPLECMRKCVSIKKNKVREHVRE